ncbi:MAG: hypothetical protein K0R56_384 [Sphingomonas sp.]|jgi:hypothetical protein|nr:hypothetical protein [Sphingomonas sp.]
MYSELVYFQGAYFAHIVAHQEHSRLQRLSEVSRRMFRRRCYPNLTAGRVRPLPPMERVASLTC